MNNNQQRKTFWLTGYPTSGKTWVGDYLQIYQDFEHVDGDEYLSLWAEGKGNPKYKDPVEDFFSYMMEYIFEQKPVPEGKGESYYDLVIEKYK